MKINRLLCAVVLAGPLSLMGMQPALASTIYGVGANPGNPGSYGQTSGGLIWLNRSVQNQGYVVDYAGGSTLTEAVFFRYTGTILRGNDTRTTSENTVRSFNFTLDGSAYSGGITRVEIWLCSDQICGDYQGNYYRP